jgi:hypothetical protein
MFFNVGSLDMIGILEPIEQHIDFFSYKTAIFDSSDKPLGQVREIMSDFDPRININRPFINLRVVVKH